MANTATSKGEMPRASGYTWPKSPMWYVSISSNVYPTCSAAAAPMYGQLTRAGAGTNGSASSEQAVIAAPSIANPTSRSVTACAMAFQEACRTAATSTAATTMRTSPARYALESATCLGSRANAPT